MADTPDDFYHLLTQHQPRLRGFVRCLVYHPSEIDDVLQETNAVLLRKSAEFELGTDFWAWASTVARYEVLSHFKKQVRRRHVFNSELIDDLALVAEQKLESVDERRSALAVCFEQMTPSRRQLLEMRYTLGHSIEAIADATNRPAGSIRQTLYRIRKLLLSCIKQRMSAAE